MSKFKKLTLVDVAELPEVPREGEVCLCGDGGLAACPECGAPVRFRGRPAVPGVLSLPGPLDCAACGARFWLQGGYAQVGGRRG